MTDRSSLATPRHLDLIYVTCDSKNRSLATQAPFRSRQEKGRGGVGCVLPFLLQLGFHVNTKGSHFLADCRPQIVDFQSMVDSHMLAARLTGLVGELLREKNKTRGRKQFHQGCEVCQLG